MNRARLLLFVLAVGGCSALRSPDPSDTAAYCTAENAFQMGSQARAYFGGCPKDREAAFLAGLERGRAYIANIPSVRPYLERMQAVERQLVSATSDADRARLRGQLTELEWWAVHLLTTPGSFGEGH